MQVSGIDSARRAPSTSEPIAASSVGAAPKPIAAPHSSATSRMEALETKMKSGQSLSPVEQGELARMQDAAMRTSASPRNLPGFDIAETIETIFNTVATANLKLPKTVKGAKTLADFDLQGASIQDRADFAKMLAYLQRADAKGNAISPTAVKLLAKLPADQVVKINHGHDDSFQPWDGVINWDPRSALKVGGTEKFQSPALGFIHEVDHAVNGLANPKPTTDGYDNTEERRVITGSERKIANDFGEPIRHDHGGAVFHVDGPNKHS